MKQLAIMLGLALATSCTHYAQMRYGVGSTAASAARVVPDDDSPSDDSPPAPGYDWQAAEAARAEADDDARSQAQSDAYTQQVEDSINTTSNEMMQSAYDSAEQALSSYAQSEFDTAGTPATP